MAKQETNANISLKLADDKKQAQEWQEDRLLTTDLGHDIVNLFVGAKKKHFTVHKALLYKRIPQFEKFPASKNNGGSGNKQTTFTIPGGDPIAFALLIDWVYTGQIAESSAHSSLGTGVVFSQWLELYILAENYSLVKVADETMHLMLPLTFKKDLFIDTKIVDRAYEELPAGSPMLRLIVDMVYLHITNAWSSVAKDTEILVQNDWDKIHGADNLRTRGALLTGILAKTQERESKAKNSSHELTPGTRPRCAYHHHAPTQGCFF